MKLFGYRLKMAFWIIGLYTVISTIALILILLYSQRTREALFQEKLTDQALEIVSRMQGGLLDDYLNTPEAALAVAFNKSTGPASEAWVTDAKGAVIWYTSDDNAADGISVVESDHDPKSFKMAVPMQLADGQVEVHVSAMPYRFEEEAWLLQRGLIALVASGMIGALLAGWVVIGAASNSMDNLKEAISQLNPASLGEEIEIDHADADTQQLATHLNEARSRLAEALSAQERFIANVSHEFRTPIAVLLAESQLLANQSSIEEEQAEEFVRSVQDEMRRLKQMVDGFLMLIQVEHGKRKPRHRRIEINDLLLDAVQSVDGYAHQNKVRVSLVLSPEADEANIYGDERLFRQMVSNLLRNAIRFSPQDEKIEVSVVADWDDKLLKVRVRDHGPGIPAEMIDRLFERFAQSTDEAKRGRGFGLGLQIAQGVADLHQGKIHAANEPDGGCSFWVTVPFSAETDEDSDPDDDNS